MSMPTYRVTITRSDGSYAAAEVDHDQFNDQALMASAVDKMRSALAKMPRRTNGGSPGIEDGLVEDVRSRLAENPIDRFPDAGYTS